MHYIEIESRAALFTIIENTAIERVFIWISMVSPFPCSSWSPVCPEDRMHPAIPPTEPFVSSGDP